MKSNLSVWALASVFMNTTIVQLPAQQDEVERKLVEQINARAEQGDAQAQFYLGTLQFNGKMSVKKDVGEAISSFRRAADQGHTTAQFVLGLCYDVGLGVGKDENEAVEWFRRAAGQGDAEAQFTLGVRYATGDHVEQDIAAAVKWWQKGADQGFADAQAVLGACYSEGRGVPLDHPRAILWYRKAAEQGHSLAQYTLAVCYGKGKGVAKDLAQAAFWYHKAAEQGKAQAQSNLGVCYVKGDGVKQNCVEAYKWFNLASKQGVEAAHDNLARLESLMMPEQIAKARWLVGEFKARNISTRSSVSIDGIADFRCSSSGTGFFVTQDGFLVTSYHVVERASEIRLFSIAGYFAARAVKVDAANDLVLRKAEGKFAPLPVAASRAVRSGNTVATVGFPNIGLQGFAPKLAKGEIASLTGARDDPRYFQISVPVQPGNSGGALVDERGNVVGVVSAKLNAAATLSTTGALPENVNYAVKSSLLLSFLESVPEVAAKLKEPITRDRKFEDVVKSAEQAAVLVLVY